MVDATISVLTGLLAVLVDVLAGMLIVGLVITAVVVLAGVARWLVKVAR